MWARRTGTAKRNAYGVATIKRASYNTKDGMSVKAGWWEISATVRKRSKGKCEALLGGVRCGAPAKDVHHIVSLSSGGSNVLPNLIHLCLSCHERRHRHMFRSRSK